MGTFVPAIEEHEALLQLESEDYRRLLDDIDSLRRADLYQVIDLPTIVVCGDTSAGKSSLLESISGGIRFPIDTTVCTRFATELVLRRGDHRVGRATVTAGPSASVQHREAVKHFVRDFDRFEELDDIFAQAKKAMKVSDPLTFGALLPDHHPSRAIKLYASANIVCRSMVPLPLLMMFFTSKSLVRLVVRLR